MTRRAWLGATVSPLLSQTPTDGVRKALASTRWINPPQAGQLPAGMSHHVYRSKSLGQDVGYCLYRPPGAVGGPRLPVIYNLHGAGGNELHGFEEARLLDKGIQERRWPPMIMVMPNGGKNTFYKDSYDGNFPAETMFIRELMPLIDTTQRTIPVREARAIEGFSMGGRGATRLAMKYPDLFCSLFNQAGNVMHTAQAFDPSKANEYPNFYLGPEKARYLDNDSYVLLERNVAKIKGRMRIQVWCGTEDDGHLPTVRQFHDALLKHGVDHTYMEIEGLAHKRTEMIARYAPIWFDYHVESFRRSGVLKL